MWQGNRGNRGNRYDDQRAESIHALLSKGDDEKGLLETLHAVTVLRGTGADPVLMALMLLFGPAWRVDTVLRDGLLSSYKQEYDTESMKEAPLLMHILSAKTVFDVLNAQQVASVISMSAPFMEWFNEDRFSFTHAQARFMMGEGPNMSDSCTHMCTGEARPLPVLQRPCLQAVDDFEKELAVTKSSGTEQVVANPLYQAILGFLATIEAHESEKKERDARKTTGKLIRDVLLRLTRVVGMVSLSASKPILAVMREHVTSEHARQIAAQLILSGADTRRIPLFLYSAPCVQETQYASIVSSLRWGRGTSRDVNLSFLLSPMLSSTWKVRIRKKAGGSGEAECVPSKLDVGVESFPPIFHLIRPIGLDTSLTMHSLLECATQSGYGARLVKCHAPRTATPGTIPCQPYGDTTIITAYDIVAQVLQDCIRLTRGIGEARSVHMQLCNDLNACMEIVILFQRGEETVRVTKPMSDLGKTAEDLSAKALEMERMLNTKNARQMMDMIDSADSKDLAYSKESSGMRGEADIVQATHVRRASIILASFLKSPLTTKGVVGRSPLPDNIHVQGGAVVGAVDGGRGYYCIVCRLRKTQFLPKINGINVDRSSLGGILDLPPGTAIGKLTQADVGTITQLTVPLVCTDTLRNAPLQMAGMVTVNKDSYLVFANNPALTEDDMTKSDKELTRWASRGRS